MNSGGVDGHALVKEQEGFQCFVVSFLPVDFSQIFENGRMKLGKLVASVFNEIIERLFREKFSRIKILSRLQAFPGSPGFPPPQQFNARYRVMAEPACVNIDAMHIDPDGIPLSDDRIDGKRRGKRFSETAQGRLEVAGPRLAATSRPEQLDDLVAVDPL